MTESAAIVQYLATRRGPSPLAVDLGDSAYGAWLNWLRFGEETLTFPQTLLMQDADGYVATLKSSRVIYRQGQATGALPGRLIRGRQPAPQPQTSK
jgi:glutathione S-transferase